MKHERSCDIHLITTSEVKNPIIEESPKKMEVLDAILGLWIKPFNIPHRSPGVEQPVRHRPTTSLCVFTLPAL